MTPANNLISTLRNDKGLLDKVSYVYNTDGSINWRKMILPQYLYPREKRDREEIEARFGKKFEFLDTEELSKIEDKQLLITLAGINNLAWLRGVKSSIPLQPIVTQGEVTSVWVVEFIPNCEDPYGLTVAGQAAASLYSVSDRFQLHLAALAGNRAYVRAVRQALRIEILGREEFDPEASEKYEKSLKEGKNPLLETPAKVETSSGVSAKKLPELLALRCQELGYTLEQIKTSALKVRSEMIENPDSAKECRINGDPNQWRSFDDIQPLDCMTLIDKINKAAEAKKSKKKT